MKLPELPFDLSRVRDSIAEVFNIGRREGIIIIASVSGALIAAVLITVIVLTVSGRASVSSEKTVEIVPMPSVVTDPGEKPFLSDFILYEDRMEESFTGVVYSREQLQKWSDKQVEEYWVEPETILAGQLEKETDKIIRDIFADVP